MQVYLNFKGSLAMVFKGGAVLSFREKGTQAKLLDSR